MGLEKQRFKKNKLIQIIFLHRYMKKLTVVSKWCLFYFYSIIFDNNLFYHYCNGFFISKKFRIVIEN